MEAAISQGVKCEYLFTLPQFKRAVHADGSIMSINITSKTDYSFLFNSLGTSKSGSAANLNFLADYASIKNGSYGKLMKAYYNMKSDDGDSSSSEKTTNKTNSTSTDTTKALAGMQSATDALKESADALLETGKDSVFEEDTLTEDAYKAVSAFVTDYNSVLTASDDINSTSVLTRTANMVQATANNANALAKVGITIGEDNSLSIDKETFLKADVADVKNLFNNHNSYAYRVSAQSSMINFAATNEASKSNTYDFTGAYSNNYTAGNIFSSFF